jgi:hypothetical protein
MAIRQGCGLSEQILPLAMVYFTSILAWLSRRGFVFFLVGEPTAVVSEAAATVGSSHARKLVSCRPLPRRKLHKLLMR